MQHRKNMNPCAVTSDKSILERFYDALEASFYDCFTPGIKGRPAWTLDYHKARLDLTLMRLRLTLSWVEGNKVNHYTDQQVVDLVLWYYEQHEPDRYTRRKLNQAHH